MVADTWMCMQAGGDGETRPTQIDGVQEKQRKTGKADGQPGYIDKRKYLLSAEVS